MAKGIIFLLLLYFQCRFVEGRKHRAAWVAYVEKITASCTSLHIQMGLRAFLQSHVICLKKQQIDLECTSTLVASAEQNFFSSPCGSIALQFKLQSHHVQQMWLIWVNHHMYVNMIFLEFSLSYSHTYCSSHQAVELLIVEDPTGQKPSSTFCGRRSPFSLTWEDNNPLVFYKAVPGIDSGYFQLQYQVCEPEGRSTQSKLDIISHNFMVKSTILLVQEFSSLTPKLTYNGWASYKIHLLSSKLRNLDLGLYTQFDDWKTLLIDVFEGPGSSAIHQHPFQEDLMNGEWIYFFTFQCYIHIECTKISCERSQLVYVWGLIDIDSILLEIEGRTEIHLTPSPCSKLYESTSTLIYCVVKLKPKELMKNRIEIQFDSIFFDGPEYLGDTSDEHNCLLAGVTVADSLRFAYNRYQEGLMEGVNSMDKDFAVDSLLAELTTCHDIGFQKKGTSGKLKLASPLDTFVSLTGETYLVIYAYGGYINLSTSQVQLIVSTTTCTGLTLGCYQIPSNGVLIIGRQIYRVETLLSQKANIFCPLGNMLFVLISVLDVYLEVIWCSMDDMTSLLVVQYPGIEYSWTETCLMINLNPYPVRYGRTHSCTLSETDIDDSVTQHYAIKTKTVQSVWCIANEWATVPVSGNTTGFIAVGRAQPFNALVSLNIYCVYLNIKILSRCSNVTYTPTVRSLTTYNYLQTDLALSSTTRMCYNQLIFIDGNRTALLRVPQPGLIPTLEKSVGRGGFNNEVASALFNFGIGRVAMILTVSVARHSHSAASCTQLHLHVVYQEAKEGRVMLLHWNFNFSSPLQGAYEVSLLQIPVSGWLMYISRDVDIPNLPPCVLNTTIRDTDDNDAGMSDYVSLMSDYVKTDRQPFGSYVLVWTSGEYTWYEAEKKCQQMGMHLASISSPEEFQLVTGLLAGRSRKTGNWFEVGILTPCRTHYPLCVVFLGLQVQVCSLSLVFRHKYNLMKLAGKSSLICMQNLCLGQWAQ